MRDEPSWRIPAGVLALVLGLAAYSLAIAVWLAPVISRLPALGQFPVYVVLGVIWLLPLRRFLIWMETGRWG